MTIVGRKMFVENFQLWYPQWFRSLPALGSVCGDWPADRYLASLARSIGECWTYPGHAGRSRDRGANKRTLTEDCPANRAGGAGYRGRRQLLAHVPTSDCQTIGKEGDLPCQHR